MAVPRSRVLDLLKVQCRIFSNTFNPDRLRLGTKVLRQRLRGPSMVDYYPTKVISIRDLEKAMPEMEFWNEKEMDREEAVHSRKVRGKGAPKKKRTAAQSKRFDGRKKKPAVSL